MARVYGLDAKWDRTLSKGFKKNRLAVAVGACILLSSGIAQALGLGDIEVETALNEPLAAKIKLLSASDDELTTLSVDLAPREAFSRMGIERHPLLRDLRFKLVSGSSGTPYIEVSSTKSVREPFLDFILTLNWANGQMLREYTLLLDPPVFDEAERAGKVSAATTQPADVVRTERVAAPVARTATAGSYGPTNSSDTLWAVGQKMRPSRDVSVPQMMIALLKENPEAFGRGNINNLKAGYVLRAPEMGVITQLSKSQAAQETSRQYQEWLADRGQAPRPAPRTQQRVAATPTPATEQVVTQVPEAQVESKPAPEARLQLLSADEEKRIRSGVGSGAADSGAADAVLQQELAIAEEASEAMRQENDELRSRLEALEEQLLSVQKLLTLKDDTLGSLQAEQQKAEQMPAEQASPEPETAEPVAEAEKPQPKPKPVVAPEPPMEEPSLVDDLMADPNMPFYAGGGLVFLLLAAWVIARRRKGDDDEEDFPVMAGMPAEATKGAAVAATGAAAAEAVEESATEAAEPVADDVSIGDFGGGMGAIHAEESEIDPIAEADVYLAYRRYEQAEALMKEAIASDPDRAELKLKLLEIYFTTKDKDSFEAQAEALYAGLAGQDDDLWLQAAEMGRELTPEHPLFSEGVAAATGAGDEVDDFADILAADEVAAETAAEAPVDAVAPEADAALSDDDLANSLMSDEFSLDAELSESADEVLDDLDLDLGDDLGIGEGVAEAVEESVDLEDFDLGEGGLEAIDGTEEPLSDSSLADALTEDFSLDEGLDSLSEIEETKRPALDDKSAGEGLDESLSSLGDELDLGSAEQVESVVADQEFDLGEGALAEDAGLESLDDLTAELGSDVEKETSDALNEFELPESLEDDADLLAGLDEMGELGDLDELPELDDLSSLDKDKDKLEGDAVLVDQAAEEGLGPESEFADLGSESTDADTKLSLDVEPATSTFESRDVDTVMDRIEPELPDVTGVKLDAQASSNEPDASGIAIEEDPLGDLESPADMDFSEMSDDEDSDIFDSSDDMVGTKLDLAKAYLEMGDKDGARSILDEVAEEGNDDQRMEAEELKQQMA